MVIAYIFGVIAGAYLAWKRATFIEGFSIPIVLTTRSAPEFWLGMIALAFFSFQLDIFPSGGTSAAGVIYETTLSKLTSLHFYYHLILPSLVLALYLQGLPLLLMRSNMLEVMQEDFVTMSKMKGLSSWRIVIYHAARNALLPVATAFTLGVGFAFGGNVVIETVFSWPGLGRLLVFAVSSSDYPLAQGAFIFLTAILILMNFLADLLYLFLDLIATNDPLRINFSSSGLARNLPPSWEYFLGTTSNGRDIFSQLIYGSRNALAVGLSAALAVAILGTIVGLISGFYGGWIDNLIMRLADIALGLPFLPFVIVLAAFLGPSSWNVVIAIGLLLWPNAGRIIRSQVLTLRERGYIESAKVSGCSNFRIIFLHIAPNILPLSFLYGSIAIGWAILTEASVSFLGFGPSDVISWGYMLQDAYSSQALSLGAYIWFIPPGICIVLMVVAGFFISRGYEEILFPKIKK